METTDTSAKDTGANQDILAVIDQKKADNLRDGKRNAMHTVIGIAAWSLASVLLPPVGIGGLVTTATVLYGSWFGWNLITNAGTERSLDLAKKEAAEDPSFVKTAERAAKGRKTYDRFDSLMMGAVAVAAVSALAMLFAPAAAALAAPLFSVSIGVGLLAGIGENLSKGSYKAAAAIASLGKSLNLRKAAKVADEPALAPTGPAPATNAPSPTVSFDKAANSNEPPKPEAKEPAPVIKPEAPKL